MLQVLLSLLPKVCASKVQIHLIWLMIAHQKPDSKPTGSFWEAG